VGDRARPKAGENRNPAAAATATPAGKTVASAAAIVMSRLPSPAGRMNVTTAVTNPTGTAAAITSWLRQRDELAGVDGVDHEALALVTVESMSAYRGMRDIFGRVPSDVDDDRLVETWVDVALAYARERGLGRGTAK
jgi:hypothetical protein